MQNELSYDEVIRSGENALWATTGTSLYVQKYDRLKDIGVTTYGDLIQLCHRLSKSFDTNMSVSDFAEEGVPKQSTSGQYSLNLSDYPNLQHIPELTVEDFIGRIWCILHPNS